MARASQARKQRWIDAADRGDVYVDGSGTIALTRERSDLDAADLDDAELRAAIHEAVGLEIVPVPSVVLTWAPHLRHLAGDAMVVRSTDGVSDAWPSAPRSVILALQKILVAMRRARGADAWMRALESAFVYYRDSVDPIDFLRAACAELDTPAALERALQQRRRHAKWTAAIGLLQRFQTPRRGAPRSAWSRASAFADVFGVSMPAKRDANRSRKRSE